MPAARPREVVRIDCQHGNTNRQGRWTVPQRMEVRINSGNVTLDFTDADITWPALQIDAEIHHGNMNLVTKPGIVVNTDDLAIHGSNVKVGAVPGQPFRSCSGSTWPAPPQQPPGASPQGAAPNVLAVADASAPASRAPARPDLTVRT